MGSDRSLRPSTRALAPATGKALEVGLVVLFIGGLTASLFGGVVPEYRTAAAEEMGERTLAAAATDVERAVPPPAQRATRTVRVDLPRTIRGATYRVAVDDGGLVLDHPHPEVGGRVRLALPDRVTSVSGSWASDGRPVVVARADADGVRIELEGRG